MRIKINFCERYQLIQQRHTIGISTVSRYAHYYDINLIHHNLFTNINRPTTVEFKCHKFVDEVELEPSAVQGGTCTLNRASACDVIFLPLVYLGGKNRIWLLSFYLLLLAATNIFCMVSTNYIHPRISNFKS